MIDRALVPVSIYDAEAVLLSPGGTPVLPFYDLPGSGESAGAPIQYQ